MLSRDARRTQEGSEHRDSMSRRNTSEKKVSLTAQNSSMTHQVKKMVYYRTAGISWHTVMLYSATAEHSFSVRCACAPVHRRDKRHEPHKSFLGHILQTEAREHRNQLMIALHLDAQHQANPAVCLKLMVNDTGPYTLLYYFRQLDDDLFAHLLKMISHTEVIFGRWEHML
jgi:hypothetical protein